MHYSPADQIHDNLRNLILTNSGERLGRYTLGTNVRTLLFDLTSADDFEAKIMGLIRSSVSRYLPIVELDTFEINASTIENDNVAEGMSLVVIKVKYNIPRLKIIGRILDVAVYSGG
jgi:phage baseplate assembly protein W